MKCVLNVKKINGKYHVSTYGNEQHV